MLQFILGRASSGKSETIYQLASKENKDNVILIVPEQFSFETERNLLKKDITGISVLNFSRLIDVVKNLYGGTAGDTLSSFDKVVVMLRALENVKNELLIYKKYYDSLEFANKLIALSNELKESSVSLGELQEVIDKIKSNTTKAKIQDVLKIFLEYDSIVSTEFLDPSDDLQRLYDAINKNKYFKDKVVYFDGFKGFSNAQLKIIKCALRDSKKVVISFCCDPNDISKRENNLFHNVYNIIDKIKSISSSVNCEILEPLILKNSYFDNDDLSVFERTVFENDDIVNNDELKHVKLLHSKNSSEMIENVLILIHRLVRTKDYKYGDFVIIARDINKYDKHIISLSEKYNIPIYFDKRKSLKYSPISRMVLSAFDASLTFKSEKIFEYLKCGLEIISENDLAVLYEYVNLWKIDGDQWLENWNMSVKGLNTFADLEDKEKCEKQLLYINEIRKRVIEPISNLKAKISNNPITNCEIIYEFLRNNKISDLLNNYIIGLEHNKNYKESEYLRGSYEPFIDVLSSLHKCFKNFYCKPQKFLELLRYSITNKTVGVIPQMCDEVSCGSADRIRPARPKVAFVIGLNQYEFPASIADNDLLLNNDRKELIDLKVDIVDKLSTYLHNENFLIYSSSCCASEKLFLCSCSNMGETIPSIFISNVKNAFPKIKTIDFSNLEDKVETIENAFSILAELDSKTSSIRKSLYEYFSNTEYKDKLEYLEKSLEINDAKLNEDFAKQHFNIDMHMSASRVDCFYKCKFNYFCKYILNLKNKKPAEIDVANRGTIVHYVLEHAIKKYSKDLASLDKHQLDEIVDQYLNEYLDLMQALELLNDNRFKFIFSKIAMLTKKTIYRIADEFKFTEFTPVFCECSIGDDVPPLVINGQNKITITGSIDRVDIYEGGKYVRVVDYKSGNVKININNLLYGLNLQMLIYLYAFIKNNKHYDALPAGVFYLPVNGGYNAQNPDMRMNGILPNDPELHMALDKSGKYIPNIPNDPGRRDNPQIDVDDYDALFEFLEYKIKSMEDSILKGNFEVSPIGSGQGGACQYCDFKSICRLESNDKIREINTDLNTSQVLDIMRSKGYEV